jgi:hypothetical protein
LKRSVEASRTAPRTLRSYTSSLSPFFLVNLDPPAFHEPSPLTMAASSGDMLDFKDLVTVVTGAGSGIGRV